MMMASKLEVRFYRTAKERLLSAGFATEINWQLEQEFGAFTETDLLREAAWAILCSGFREAVVRRCFDPLAEPGYAGICRAARLEHCGAGERGRFRRSRTNGSGLFLPI